MFSFFLVTIKRSRQKVLLLKGRAFKEKITFFYFFSNVPTALKLEGGGAGSATKKNFFYVCLP